MSIVCFGSIALTDDIKTINGKEYKNATVSRVEPDGIVVKFSGGIVKLAFTELPEETRNKPFKAFYDGRSRFQTWQRVRESNPCTSLERAVS